jgi:DNA adenine methylase
MAPRTPVGEAARFLYLNRTCWGGVFRLNREGEFNVPFGHSGRVICRADLLLETAEALKVARLGDGDFEAALSKAGKGDVIYADPPYTTVGQGNGFLRYNEKLFRWSDQQRLARACREIAKRGTFVAVSGLLDPQIVGLYPGWWLLKLHRKSLISRTPDGRRNISEVILFSRWPASAQSVFNTPIVRVESLGSLKQQS